jgi:hypothetical protein
MTQTKTHDTAKGCCDHCASPKTCANFERCVLEPLTAEQPEADGQPQAIAAE